MPEYLLPTEFTSEILAKYPMWFLQYLQDVVDMRDAQKAYFQQSSDYKLRVAKAKEAKVDAFNDRAIKAGLATHLKTADTKQGGLFNG